MKKKTLYLVVLFALIAVGLVGCELRASTPPPATSTTSQDFPAPGTPAQTMGVFQTIGTLTAIASEAAAAGTPVPPAETDPGTAPGDTEQPTEPPVVVPQPPAQEPVVNPVEIPDIEVPSTYRLEKDEFPYCIARRFDINPVELLSANGLSMNSVVQPGATLRIPANANGFPGASSLHSHPTTYSVRAGDTIYKVACYFGDVSPEQIIAANGLSAPYTISAGETLQIP